MPLPKGFNMLNGYDEDLENIDFTLPADELKKALLEKANQRADGLANKNKELLGKVSSGEALTASEKAKLTELERFKDNSDIEAAKAAAEWSKASELQKQAWEKEKSQYLEENSTYKKNEESRLITDGIRSQLTDIRLNPLHSDTVLGFFKSQSSIVDGKAMIGDKTQSEYITEWSQTDSGKASCLAPINSNGDAAGTGKTPPQGAPVNQAAEAAQKSGNLDAYLAATMRPVA